MSAFAIARSGLGASMTRLTVSAANLANASSAGPLPGESREGGPYVCRTMRAELSAIGGGGVATKVVQNDPGIRRVYDPSSPDANRGGMIAIPDVDIAQELVEQVQASQAFAANLKVICTALDLEKQSLDL